ncbi:MAG: hypothetical protein ACYTBV_20130, partial [Planctomycetota bacterium]
IEKSIQVVNTDIEYWQNNENELNKMYEKGVGLEEIYDWDGNWELVRDKFSYLLRGIDGGLPVSIRKTLNQAGLSDDKIWKAHIEICDKRTTTLKKDIEKLEREKKENKLSLQVEKKLACIPNKKELERLLRYETAIERQLYKALNQLERMQRLRAGDNVPAPIKIDLDLNNPTTQ